jgi:hypothetical protein
LVVVLILTAFRTDEAFSELAAAIQWSVKTGAILLAAGAVIVGLIAAVATFESQDPWRYLPGGPPPALREFARQHPDLRVTDWGDFGVAVEDRESNRVILSRWDLLEPAFSWEKCADASEPARMGGPPPLPGSKCLLRIRIIKPDYDALSDEEADRDVVPPQLHRTIYVYSIGWIGADKVEEHFRGWIKSAGLEGNYSHYQTNQMEVEVGGGKWSISVVGQRKRPKDIYVEYAERRGKAKSQE